MATPSLAELLAAYKLQTQGPGEAIEQGREGFMQGAQLANLQSQRNALDQYRQASLGERIREAVSREGLGEQKQKFAETKPSSEFSVASGIQAPEGKVPVIDKFTGNIKLTDAPGTKPAKDMTSSYAAVRQRQFIMSDLPSNKAPTSVPGAASSIQLAVRQGKALIAKPGSAQQIALASSDLARAVQRSAPQLETLKGSSFANNYVTKVNALLQKITANPAGPDVPKLRKQVFDILDDLEKSSQPMVERQLKHVEDIYQGALPNNWDAIKKQELGGEAPEIMFQESNIPSEGKKSEQKITNADDFRKKYGLK